MRHFGVWYLLKRLGRGSQDIRLPQYYITFLGRVGEQGFSRSPGETFSRFHQRLAGEGWSASLLGELETALEQDLYSRRPAGEDDRRGLLQKVLDSKKGAVAKAV